MGAPSVSCLAVPVQAGTGPLRLVHLLVTVDVVRKLLLRVATEVRLRLLPRVAPEWPAVVLVDVRVLEFGASSTAPRIFCALLDSPSIGDWHPTSLFLGSGTCDACMACPAPPQV